MAQWKKVLVSGSNISQLNNDSLYIPKSGTMASGYLGFWNSTTTLSGEANLFWDATNDRLGIGKSAPTATLDVNGNTYITGSGYITGQLAVGTNNPVDSKVYIYNDLTQALGSENPEGIYTYLNRTHTGTATTSNNYTAGYFKNIFTNSGVGSQTVQNILAVDSDLLIQRTSTGTVTASLAAMYTTSYPTIGDGVRVGTFANFYGTSLTNSGFITSYYDLYLPGVDPTSTGTITTKYGIYQADGTLSNYFSGSISTAGSVTAPTGVATPSISNGVGATINLDSGNSLFDFTVAGNSRLTVRGDKVGINKSIPTAALDVNGNVLITGSLGITTIGHAGTDTDRFLVSNNGSVEYRTGAELLSDIGGQAAITNPITGTGANTYVPYFTGPNTITGSAGFTYVVGSSELTTPYLVVTNSATIGNNLTVNGDLTVKGTTTIIDTANLVVEDRFILLASGSTSTTDGGIIVQSGGGAAPVGESFFFDSGTSRWSVSSSVSHTTTGVVPAAHMSAVVDLNQAGQSDVTAFQKNGNIKVDTSGDIWIYA